MGEGPRDWSPPGYWDDRPAARWPRADQPCSQTTRMRPGRRSWAAGLSILFGLGALVVTFAPGWTNQPIRLVWTTAGLTAIYFGVVHLRRGRHGGAGGRILASLGIGSGALATALLVWGVVWAEIPGFATPPQVALANALHPADIPPAAAAPPPAPGASSAPQPSNGNPHSYELRAGRAVAPLANAKQVEPAYQLQTNLVATAYEICSGLASYHAQYGALPPTLSVQADGTVASTTVSLSAVLPAYMRFSYAPAAPEGTAFLTVADIASGMAMSCIHSDSEMWIGNS